MTGPAVPDYGPATFGERQALPLDGFSARLEQMLAGAPAEGAASLQALDALTPEQQQAAATAARLFLSDEGRALLEFLADASVRRPMALPPLGTDPVQAYCHVQRRAGQDDMFFYLLALIAKGREEQPPTREGAQL